eukprot:4608551-Pleurochrysis_carterae.AAC.1
MAAVRRAGCFAPARASAGPGGFSGAAHVTRFARGASGTAPPGLPSLAPHRPVSSPPSPSLPWIAPHHR